MCRRASGLEARENVTGAGMLHNAVSSYKAADAKGLDVLEPTVIRAAVRHEAGQALLADSQKDLAAVCTPRHADYNEAECASQHSGAFMVPVLPAS